MLKKKISSFFFIISGLLFLFIIYKSEFFFLFKINEDYLFYLIISIILIFFSTLTFFFSSKINEYIIISVLSIIISLYLFEGYLTLNNKFNFTNVQKIYKKKTGNKYDTRTKFQIYSDLKKINNNYTITVSALEYAIKEKNIIPFSGMSNSETIYCNENGFYSIYQSDRYGFNNPDNEWNKKKVDYLLLGDSFVHGACVNRPNDISSQLRAVSKKTVLNLGYSGNGPLVKYATLREYMRPNIKKIIWFYYEGNDMRDLKKELKNELLLNYINNLDFSQELKIKSNEINKLSISLIAEAFEREEEIIKRMNEENKKILLQLINYIKIYNTRMIFIKKKKSEILYPSPPEEFKKILKLTKDLADKNNSKLFFVYLPSIDRYKNIYNDFNLEEIKKITVDLKIPFIDIHTKVFSKERYPLNLFPFQGKNGIHYNEEGYKKIANILYEKTK